MHVISPLLDSLGSRSGGHTTSPLFEPPADYMYSKPTPYEKINKFLHLVASTPEGIKEDLLYVAYKLRYGEDLQMQMKPRQLVERPIPKTFVQIAFDHLKIAWYFPASLSKEDIEDVFRKRSHAVPKRSRAVRSNNEQQRLIKLAAKIPTIDTINPYVDDATLQNILALMHKTRTSLYFGTFKLAYEFEYKSKLIHRGSLHDVFRCIPQVKQTIELPKRLQEGAMMAAGSGDPAADSERALKLEAAKREFHINPTILLSLRREEDEVEQEGLPVPVNDGWKLIPNCNFFTNLDSGSRKLNDMKRTYLTFHLRPLNGHVAMEVDEAFNVVVAGLIVAFKEDIFAPAGGAATSTDAGAGASDANDTKARRKLERSHIRRHLTELLSEQGVLSVSLSIGSAVFADTALVLFAHTAMPRSILPTWPGMSVHALPSLVGESRVTKLFSYETSRLSINRKQCAKIVHIQKLKEGWGALTPSELRELNAGRLEEERDVFVNDSEEEEGDDDDDDDDEEGGEVEDL